MYQFQERHEPAKLGWRDYLSIGFWTVCFWIALLVFFIAF